MLVVYCDCAAKCRRYYVMNLTDAMDSISMALAAISVNVRSTALTAITR
jgi:hypothetical protein